MGNRQCDVQECDRKAHSKGYCHKHYRAYHLYGDPLGQHPTEVLRPCSAEGCETPVNGRGDGLCRLHWKRRARNGDPDIVIRIRNSHEKRFWSKVTKDGPIPVHRPELGPCWPWIAKSINNSGYAMFRLGGTHVQGHRYAYELLVGPIPEGLVIDHLCRNILCTNPAHMEPVTNGENLRRMWAVRFANGWRPRARTEPYIPPANDATAVAPSPPGLLSLPG